MVAAEEEAAAGEFTVPPQPQASCPKPGGAPRSKVRWLPLPAFQGYLGWALTALSLHPVPSQRSPPRDNDPHPQRHLLLQSLEWDTEGFGPSLPTHLPGGRAQSQAMTVWPKFTESITLTLLPPDLPWICRLSPYSATPSLGTGYRVVAIGTCLWVTFSENQLHQATAIQKF